MPSDFESATEQMLHGVDLARQGRLKEAIDTLRSVVKGSPQFAQAHLNLGVALCEERSFAEAAVSLQKAVECKSDYPEAYYNLGNALRELNRTDEAIAAYRRCLELRPDYPENLNNFALALLDKRRTAEAIVYLKQALRLRPQFLEAFKNLGLAYTNAGLYELAEASYERALDQRQAPADTLGELAASYQYAGQLDRAVACYDLAVAQQPNHVSLRWNRSLALLQNGDFERGWLEYEWRLKKPDSAVLSFPQPRWQGEPLEGKTILLHAEQGWGDIIQFIRYAPLVQAQGGRVIFLCPRSLVPLLARTPGIDHLLPDGETPMPFDCHASLMSLPLVLQTRLDSVPNTGPYVFADPDRSAHWRARLETIKGMKVGIAWQGNPRHRADRTRSTALKHFSPLSSLPEVSLISLQRGPGTEQLPDFQKKFSVTDLGNEVTEESGSFFDTAAILPHLDLVITVDTALGHLAGSMAVPTWIALSAHADWRWLRGRTDSPWYPTVRLFRQAAIDGWSDVFAEMRSALEPVARARTRSDVTVAISPGELLDKWTILQIKRDRVRDPEALGSVEAQLDAMRAARLSILTKCAEAGRLELQLRTVNESLWTIEDDLRACECLNKFDEEFIRLARSVYRNNDERAALKRQVNDLLRSPLQEVKLHPSY
jgi:tetratricopeptide (TPR) repeat protein